VQLDEEAKSMLIHYPWKGNVRELKNIAEQISVLSTDKMVTSQRLRQFLPEANNMNRLPVLAHPANSHNPGNEFANEREILYKLFFDMKKDVTELKKMFVEIIQNPASTHAAADYARENFLHELPQVNNDFHAHQPPTAHQPNVLTHSQPVILDSDIQHHEEVEESLNIMDKEKELIIKALKKHKGKRKDASSDLGISERTLYRKLKEYDIDE